MRIERISENHFKALYKSDDNYYMNGCVFDEENDNLLAFTDYEPGEGPAYFKVVR